MTYVGNNALQVAAAQLPIYAGDLTGNRNRIIDAARQAQEDGADILITNEMSLVGYPIDDLLGDPDFLDRTRDELTNLAEMLPPSIIVAVGTPMWIPDLPDSARSLIDFSNPLDSEQRNLVNALVLFKDGEEIGYVIKHFLPTYGVFDDARWFEGSIQSAPPITVNGINVGFAICEDVWADAVVDDLADAGAEVILVANASPYAEGKQEIRTSLLKGHATRRGVPIMYVNAVGGQDEVVYDGGSMLATPDGEIVGQCPAFETGTWTFTIPVVQENARMPRVVAPDGPYFPYGTSNETTYKALVTGLRDYINRSGANGVIIGLSGGLDSALAAVIAVDAIGAEKVTGVAMPGPYSSEHSVTDAVALATNLNIANFITLPIKDTYLAEKEILGTLLQGPGQKVADENIQARLRALHLMTLANSHNLITLNTGNKSEASVGYFTLGGDSSGGFAILKDVYKTRAYELSRWRNEQATLYGEVPPIPENTITKPPSAELAPGQEDTDSLPPYPVLDTILTLYLEDRLPRVDIVEHIERKFDHPNAQETVRRVIRMITIAEHKRRQVAPGVKVTARAYGRDRRYPIINAFFG